MNSFDVDYSACLSGWSYLSPGERSVFQHLQPAVHALFFVVTSVPMLLPPSLPQAVLIKAFGIREYTYRDWKRDIALTLAPPLS